MEKKWWHKSVVYQIYPRSFNDTTGNGVGDINGIIEKLDYLNELGVDVIWLSPVYKSPMKDNGYDISDYQDIDPLFGTLDDMDRLIKEANEREIKIVMDLVVNHTSDQHEWFKEARKSKDNPYRDYYIWRDEPSDLKSTFGGSAWTYDNTTGQYYFHNFAKGQPDLNWENPKVQDEIHNMINWWLDRGISGFRMDVIDLIGKEIDKKIIGNGPRLHPLLQDMNKATFGNYDVLTVGETWGANPEIAELYSSPSRKELSMIFQFEHMTLDWGEFGKWTPKELDFKQLKQILSKWQTDLENGWNSLFWNNHDLPRIVSRWGNDGIYRVESAKMLATILHMMKGTPYVYQGEEIAMTNVKFDSLHEYNDVEIHGTYRDIVEENKLITHDEFMNGVYIMGRDNARTPMQWTRNEHAGFTNGLPWLKLNPNFIEINVEDALNDPKSVFYTYKQLIDLRKNSEYSDTIIYGDYQLILENHEAIFAYSRFDSDNELFVIANFTENEQSVDLGIDAKEVIVSNYIDTSTKLELLRPYEACVLKIK
ncbi:glycoside hydrolase family 13 protein [Haloplasma contractile]|uniref:Trehalose-6-P hydrolase protein n=1 Tax=Haloplasma contractile SSD-17B TaxID=1033810 RepID=U2FPU3_9MOLU|nr:alpha-glucosidase [Haloplasma contractile]ERJ13059.1 Trehalose-6-P hydrolase protein [Haloplasma contractile SSD-17B]